MPHNTKIPPVKLTLDKDLFNKLLSILDSNIKMNIEDENYSVIATKLKDKLLSYSVPRVNEENVEFVDVRFFTNEASNMIWQLLLRTEINDSEEDYYSVLLKQREDNK